MSETESEGGAAEAAPEIETEHEQYLRAARARTNAVADRLAKAAGFEGELRPGKIVRLKSGGPPMTIAVVDIVDGLVYCHYFWRGTTGQARYSAEMLEACEAASLDSLIPPPQAGPNTYHPASGQTLSRERRQSSRESKASESRTVRARRQSSPKSKVKSKPKTRPVREPASQEIEAAERRESNRAWRAHMRRLAQMKRVAAERERILRADRASEPDKHVDWPTAEPPAPAPHEGPAQPTEPQSVTPGAETTEA
jgi:uncharacterized protein YodC (DUF2158 family)